MAAIKEEDGFWKEVLDAFFKDFVELLFPAVYAGIDWSAGFRSRDKELLKLNRENVTGSRFVDKLVEVKRLGGDRALVLVHIEVQSQRDREFERRMWTYYYRLRDRHGSCVASLALLADNDADWRPDSYETELWGSGLRFFFLTSKLLDFASRKAELEESPNPFALLMLAVLKAQETASGGKAAIEKRSDWKLRAMRSLYERDWSKKQIGDLFWFLDWAVRLPDDLNDQLRIELANTEEGKKMTYVTSFERYGIRKGMEKGLEQGREEGREQGRLSVARETVLDALEIRFGDVPEPVRAAIDGIVEPETCKKLHHAAIRADSLEDFSAQLRRIDVG